MSRECTIPIVSIPRMNLCALALPKLIKINKTFLRIRPCRHALCRDCYESILVELKEVDGKPQPVSNCPVSGCKISIDRAVAWPHTATNIGIENLFMGSPVRMRQPPTEVPRFESSNVREKRC
jgi:hypothetical protein